MNAERKPKQGPVKRKPKRGGRYEVYTRPELHDVDHPGATWLVRIAIVLTMVGMIAVLHRPLLAALSAILPSWHK